MKSFDFNRFLRLVRWTVTMDWRYWLKTVLTMTAVLALLFLFITSFGRMDSDTVNLFSYKECSITVFLATLMVSAICPAFMFSNMTSRHADEWLFMLPASNLEKYALRYISGLLLLPALFISLLGADSVQYIMHTLAGHEGMKSVTGYLFSTSFFNFMFGGPNDWEVLRTFLSLIFWINSLYALGAAFFRSHRFNWVATSVLLVVGGTVVASVFQDHTGQVWWNNRYFFNPLFITLGLLNLVLAYRLFCRWQLVGRYVNL